LPRIQAVGWAKGALAPCPPSISNLILDGGHASAFALRATADALPTLRAANDAVLKLESETAGVRLRDYGQCEHNSTVVKIGVDGEACNTLSQTEKITPTGVQTL
jgi:hypothetical protein